MLGGHEYTENKKYSESENRIGFRFKYKYILNRRGMCRSELWGVHINCLVRV